MPPPLGLPHLEAHRKHLVGFYNPYAGNMAWPFEGFLKARAAPFEGIQGGGNRASEGHFGPFWAIWGAIWVQ